MIELQSRFVHALGLAVLDFIWQGLLVWAGTAAALRALRGPRARYAVSCAALALCLALPAAGLLGRLTAPVSRPVAAVEKIAPPTGDGAPALRPALPLRVRAAMGARLDLVVLLWAVGAGLASLRLASGLTWVSNLEKRGTCPADPEWWARMERLAERLGLSRRVLLKVSATIDSPVSFGWLRPVILLPAALVAGMDPALLEALLAHELAHVRRLDYLANLAQTAVETLLFYHPGVWWISRRMRQERELICDDLAAGALGEPRRLALALQGLDLFQSAPTHLAQAAHGGKLMHRIRRLIQPDPHPAAWKLLLAVAGFATLCGASAAALAQATPEKRPALDFAIVTQNTEAITRSGVSTSELGDLKSKLGKDFIWFRSQGKPYVVTDPQTVAKAKALYKPMDDLGEEMGAVGRQMAETAKTQEGAVHEPETAAAKSEISEIGRQMGTIGRQQGAIGRQQADIAHQMEKLQRNLDFAPPGGAEMEVLETKLNGFQKTLDELNTKMEALEAPMEALSQRMEHATEPLKELGRRMDGAAKPLSDLGGRMKGLSQKMKALDKEAMAGLKKLTDESLANGKAVPVR